MAGDWIKMRTNLREDPAVIGIAEQIGASEDLVVGLLHRLWSWADGQTVDGAATNVTGKWIDRFLGVPGFAKAIADVRWLQATEAGVIFPSFEKHNGATAKRRADSSRRVSAHRDRNKDVTDSRYKKVTVPRALRSNLFDRDGGTCVYCGREHGEILPHETKRDGFMTLDHVIPESRGGDTNADNLVTCCNSCNNKKGDRTPDEAGMKWPISVTGNRYGCVTSALPEKRREEKSIPPTEEYPLPPDAKATEPDQVAIPTNLDTDEFKREFAAWVAFRKSKRKPISPLARKQQLTDLSSWCETYGMPAVIEAIHAAIRGDWSGLFPPKPNSRAGPRGKPSADDPDFYSGLKSFAERQDGSR